MRLPELLATGVFVLTSAAAYAQDERLAREARRRDDALLAEFSRKSASELIATFFENPPYPLFVIRRLIDLGDVAARPALRAAFERETGIITRQFLAAALVKLGDKDARYFRYVAEAAAKAVRSDLPYSVSAAASSASKNAAVPTAVLPWARINRIYPERAVWLATIELPAAVEALGETADRRSLPILLRGLRSPNYFIVNEAAFGLARLGDPKTIKVIIRACERLGPDERRFTARALLYFDRREAQRAAEQMIANPELLERWREESRVGLKASLRH
jgi:hypothetical protein